MTQDELTAEWMNKQVWLTAAEPEIELRQAKEEGLDISQLEPEFHSLINASKQGVKDVKWHRQMGELLEKVQRCYVRANNDHIEPSGFDGIRSLSEQKRIPMFKGDETELLRRLHGGLLGRICGCMLGKPFEGWRKPEIQAWNEETGNWPLVDYVREPNTIERALIRGRSQKTELGWAETWTREKLRGAVEDDDINYTIAGFDIVRKYGAEFRPVDVAEYWCANLPLFMMCTAERVAYRNFTLSVLPPDSATFRNPYREWIGAQIRADSFGYLNPGDPARAAEWAWRDASVSHIKNGIYGEMWVAAMLAAAYVLDDYSEIIQVGLSYVPLKCRLRHYVDAILTAHGEGKSYDEAVALVHKHWDETTAHGWCHTISNAMLVAIALLWGENDFGLTISRAVMPGFDTDCNGATAGSIWGVVNGADKIPEHWSDPIQDTVRSHLLNYRELKISELAGQMVSLIKVTNS